MNWNVGPEVLYWVAITITQTSVISENASVIHLVSRAGPERDQDRADQRDAAGHGQPGETQSPPP